jgi:hypothetical protein
MVNRRIERNHSHFNALRVSKGTGVASSVTELSELPPVQRVARYRALAADARREAAACNGAMRESYLLMAHHWDILARAVETSTPMPETSE